MDKTARSISIALIFVMLLAACGSGEATGSGSAGSSATSTISSIPSTEPEPVFELADFTRTGGCASVVHASNSDWTQVVQIHLGQLETVEPGVPTDFEIGNGVSAVLVTGRNLGNLFCNDYLEGNEKEDASYTATSGSVTVTLDGPFTEGSPSNGVEANVVATNLLFEVAPELAPVTVASLEITASIGWYPG